MISEILQEIFIHLADTFVFNGTYDLHAYSNLYSCILVNRHWCRNAMIILWRQPFHPCLDTGHLIVNTLLSFLDEEERDFLFSQGIIHLPPSLTSKTYLFDYPIYFRHLHQQKLYFSVESWCRNNLQNKPDNATNLLMNSLLKLIYKKSGQLVRLKLYNLVGLIRDNMDYKNHEDSTVDSSYIYKFITQVKQLTINGSYENSNMFLMPLFSQLCTNVQHLCIEHFSIAKNIDCVIKSQTNLVSLEISNLSGHSASIIQSILSQSKSLRNIKFYKVNFTECCQWTSIAFCKKLEMLEIYDCLNLNSFMVLPLLTTKFPLLKRVSILGNNDLECWIKNNSSIIERN
ncbi:8811_t:CDS:2 [Funneliformis geosporum]|uniref:8811_t:CDS:1 n=1 Tax=Funneliformis geosporum TaxID=1117311 RepID=A0A9W4T1A0_9GLOM|nr:8811_t:CDS:2 [Funneliformis geosporum]